MTRWCWTWGRDRSAAWPRRAPESVTAVVVSHLHPDHHVDLVALRHYLKYGLEPSGSVSLHAPAELRARYDAFLGEPDFLAELPGADLAPGTLTVGPFSVEARPVTHALNSFGFRVTAEGLRGWARAGLLRATAAAGRTCCRSCTPWRHAAERGLLGRDPGRLGGSRPHDVPRSSVGRSRGGAARLVLTHIPDAHDPGRPPNRHERCSAGPLRWLSRECSSSSRRLLANARSALPVTPSVRSSVRESVERAWVAAVESGALPALSGDAAAPAVELNRPANPTTATWRRTWRSSWRSRCAARRWPLPRRWPPSCATAAPGTAPTLRSRPWRWPRPASSTSGSPRRTWNARWIAPRPRAKTSAGSRRRTPEAHQRGVRLRQPDRAADGRQRPRRVRRRPPVARPGGRRAARHAGVLLQRLGRGRCRCSARRWPRGAPDEPLPEEGYRGDYVEDLAQELPDEIWARAIETGADRDAILGTWASERIRAGHRGQPGAPRRPFRRLEVGGVAPPRGLGGARRGAAARRRPRLRAGRRDVVPLDGLRRRQGPRDLPLERRADLLRRRHRLRDREVQPRLRQADLRLGRGPPRHRGARAERGRGHGLRQGSRGDAADRLGPLRSRRRGDLHVQARRRVHHPRRAAGRGRRRRRALVLRLARPQLRHRLRHRAGQEAVQREPGLLRAVRPRPDRLDPAQGGRHRA